MTFRWFTARGPRITVALALALAAFHAANELRVLAGGPANFIQRLELTALDVKTAFRGPRRPDPWRVAVAAIDERALQRFGPLPWDRSLHAELVEKLGDLQAGAIAFDMTFDRPASGFAQQAVLDVVEAFRDAQLDSSAQALRTGAEDLSELEPGQPDSADRRAAARRMKRIADRIDRFEEVLEIRSARPDPDELFAQAIEKNGRVVLGVVAYSQREAEALAMVGDSSGPARIGTSTITSVVVDEPSGLTRVLDAREHFERGLYRRYFAVQPPTERLAAASRHFGLINAAPDVDGVNRRMPLIATVKGQGVAVPSLALKAAQVALQVEELEVVAEPTSASADAIRLGALAIDTELGGTTILDWPAHFEPGRFPIVSVVDVIDLQVPPEQIRDRVVFVAATAVGTHDQRVTPLEPAVPGVYVHATLAQNILEGRRLRRPSFIILLELLILIVVGWVAGVVMARFRLWGQLGTAVGLSLFYLVVSQLLFHQGLVIATVLPMVQIFLSLLAMSMWSYLVEQRERRQTRRAFAQYLSPVVLEHVLAEPEEYLKLGGRRYEATVLFSDIRGFTTISESLTPEALGRLLNEYMTPMTNIVFAHQGTLDKYIGDAVMAFWGAPVEQPDHALRACRAALEMQREVGRLSQRFAEEGLPPITIGIGLSTGPMTIGNMGSDDHFAYTALGDRVNLGSRLENQTKELGVGIIISEATYLAVESEMLGRPLGLLRVKGKSEPVRIFELLDEKPAGLGRLPFVEAFERGLERFQTRDWDGAVAAFEVARGLSGASGDRVSDLYIETARYCRASPPPPDWDGTFVRRPVERSASNPGRLLGGS